MNCLFRPVRLTTFGSCRSREKENLVEKRLSLVAKALKVMFYTAFVHITVLPPTLVTDHMDRNLKKVNLIVALTFIAKAVEVLMHNVELVIVSRKG